MNERITPAGPDPITLSRSHALDLLALVGELIGCLGDGADRPVLLIDAHEAREHLTALLRPS